MKKLYKLIYLLPVLIILIGVNYAIDPAHLFSNDTEVSAEDDYEKVMVKMISEGYNVTNVENYSERLFQKYFVESIKTKPDVLVLGSSKSQLIGSSFSESSVLNGSVTGATLEDILGVYSLYDEKDIEPNKLILELSPWVLNDNNEQTRWKNLEENYNRLVGKLDSSVEQGSMGIPPKYLELISFEYFQQSIKKVLENKLEGDKAFFFNRKEFIGDFKLAPFYQKIIDANYDLGIRQLADSLKYINDLLVEPGFYEVWLTKHSDVPLMEEVEGLVIATKDYRVKKKEALESFELDNIIKLNRKLLENTFWESCPIYIGPSLYKTPMKDNQFLTRIIDGTISYPEKYRLRKQKKVDFMATRFASKNIFGIENFNEVSQEKLNLLKRFMQYILDKEIEIEVILVPYHSIVFDKIKSDPKYSKVLTAENSILELSKSIGINCKGSYSPYKVSIPDSAFYDGMHLKESFLHQLID